MENLIKGYKKSCDMAEARIKELLKQRKELEAKGRSDIIDALDLDRRIRLLYTECQQMQEIITHLNSFIRHLKQTERYFFESAVEK